VFNVLSGGAARVEHGAGAGLAGGRQGSEGPCRSSRARGELPLGQGALTRVYRGDTGRNRGVQGGYRVNRGVQGDTGGTGGYRGHHTMGL